MRCPMCRCLGVVLLLLLAAVVAAATWAVGLGVVR